MSPLVLRQHEADRRQTEQTLEVFCTGVATTPNSALAKMAGDVIGFKFVAILYICSRLTAEAL